MVAEVKELHSNSTQIERMQRIFDAQKAAYRQHPYPSAEQRIELIKANSTHSDVVLHPHQI